MIFPIGDTQVIGGYKPYISYVFIALNIFVFFLQLVTPGNLVCEWATIPFDIIHGNSLHTLITSMFLHAGYMHIVGNLIFLWVFADNIEATIGNFNFLIFYLSGGIIASLAHIYLGGGLEQSVGCCIPCQDVMNGCNKGIKVCPQHIPSLGASGALSAVMGAYLIMFPSSRIKILFLVIFRTFFLSAWVFLGIWFLQQLIAGLIPVAAMASIGIDGVAWWAHIGGFVFGIFCGYFFKKKFIIDKVVSRSYNQI